MKRLTLHLGIFSLLLFLSAAASGMELAKKVGFGIHGGGYKLALSERSDIWTVGGLANVGLKYGISNKFAIGAEGSWMQTYLADLSKGSRATDGAKFTTDNLDDGPRQRAFIGGLVAEYHFMPNKGWSPYIFGGPGIYIWKWADISWTTLMSDDPALAGAGIPDTDRAGNPYELKDKELYGLIGLGVEFFAGEHLSLEVGGKFRYLTHLLTDFKGDQDIVGKNAGELDLPKAVGEAYAGLTFYFGGQVKDQDLDGVPDKKDQCPDTPTGCKVDLAGCTIDSDGDGVCDGIDQCENTPKGARVDSKGCPMDSDGDGVPDGVDKCLGTAKGCMVDATGCPKDSDGDGVCDGIDKCADTPKGCQADSAGCTMDSDGDGVCDGIDQCPNTPAGTKVNSIGCTIPTVEFIPTPEKPLVLKGVNFETNKAVLFDTSKVILDLVAVSLMAHPEVQVEIGGHTDATGSNAHNMQLSEERAKVVRDYLVGKGVKPENLYIKGYGEDRAIASNATKAGRAQNRRVELTRIQ